MDDIRYLTSFYQLVDPRDSLPFYVGQTLDLARRQKDYLNGRTQHSTALRKRIYELKQAGLQPIMQELESQECTAKEALQREADWIHRRLNEGYKLINVLSMKKGDEVKATYYITPAQDLKLEELRLARRQRGERVDKSALIREAIDRLAK